MEKRFNGKESKMLKNMFPDDEHLKLARKVFLPEVTQNAPISGNQTLLNTIDGSGSDEAVTRSVITTLKLVGHIEGVLNMLKAMNSQEEKTEDEVKEAITKNSSK